MKNIKNKINQLKLKCMISSIMVLILIWSMPIYANSNSNLKQYNKDEYNIDVVVDKNSDIYDKDYKRESFSSLRLGSHYNLVFKGKKMPIGYEFIYNGKKYYATNYVHDKKSLRKVEYKTYTSLEDYKKSHMITPIRPQYGETNELREIINKFERLNKNSKDFDTELYNIMKTILEEKLEYGGDSYDQGNLSDRKTKCDGFTWIFASLLDKTNIPYRTVTITPDIYEKDGKFHIYIEVLNKNGIWTKIECTEFAYKPGEVKDDKFIKSRLNYVTRNIRESEFRENLDVYINKDKSDKPIRDVSYILSDVRINGKIVEPSEGVINIKTFKDDVRLPKI